MKKLILILHFCLLGCYPDSVYRNSKQSISEKTREDSWLALLMNSKSPSICKSFAISYANTSLNNLYFLQGQGAISVISDIVSKLHIVSNSTVLNLSSSPAIKNNMFLYNSDVYKFNGCKSIDNKDNIQSSINGFWGLEYKSNYEAIVSFYRSGVYMIFLETGDPNFNPTDIYAVME